MNSVEVTQQLFLNGTITKEAAVRILTVQRKLIKEAYEDLTCKTFRFGKYAAWSPFGPSEADVKKIIEATMKAGKQVPTKSISFAGSAKNILPLLGIAGLAALGSTAARVGINAVSDMHTSAEIKNSYQGIFREFPDLKEEKVQATKFFDMMAKFAPSLASNPIVAGTWVKQMLNSNVVDPKNIHSLIQAQADFEDVRAMKSPLVGFSREFPQVKDILRGAMVHGASGAE